MLDKEEKVYCWVKHFNGFEIEDTDFRSFEYFHCCMLIPLKPCVVS